MGLIGGIARTAVIAGTATAVSNRVARYQAGRWAAEDQAKAQHGYIPPPAGTYYGRYQYPMFQPAGPGQQSSPAQLQPAAPTDEMSSRLVQLQQLGALKAQGVLNEAEFEAQKRKILDA